MRTCRAGYTSSDSCFFWLKSCDCLLSRIVGNSAQVLWQRTGIVHRSSIGRFSRLKSLWSRRLRPELRHLEVLEFQLSEVDLKPKPRNLCPLRLRLAGCVSASLKWICLSANSGGAEYWLSFSP